MKSATKQTGVFFDGRHTLIGLKAYLNNRILDISFKSAEKKLQAFIENDTGIRCNIIYQGWFEGIKRSYLPEDKINRLNDIHDVQKLKAIIRRYHNDRTLHCALIEAGIEPIWLQLGKDDVGKPKEKGVDTALVVSVLRRVDMFDLDVIILFTNDRDFEPLFHNIRKNGTSIIIVNCSPERKLSERPFRFVDQSYYYKNVFPEISEILT